MKRVAASLSLLVVYSTASAVDQPPKALRDKGQVSIQALRSFSTHSPIGTGLPYSIECKGKLTDPYFGYLNDEQFFVRKMPVNLVCYQNNDEQTAFPVVRFDSESKKWVKDASEWEKDAEKTTDSEHRKHLERLIRTTLVYDVRAVNSQGWALTQEDLIGDEDNRTRHLTYCLIHPPKALCGEGEVGYLKDGPKADLTEYALRILRSIEFLDDEPAKPEAAPPSTTQRESLPRPNE